METLQQQEVLVHIIHAGCAFADPTRFMLQVVLPAENLML